MYLNMKQRRFGFHDIHVASYDGDSNTVLTLLAGGAYVNAVDAWGRTPLHFAVRFNDLEQTLPQLLLKFGADPTIRDFWGRTAHDVRAKYAGQYRGKQKLTTKSRRFPWIPRFNKATLTTHGDYVALGH